MTFDKFPVLLKAREQELTAIYENVPGIVFYIEVEPGGEFRFVSVSRDFLTATGLSREQVVGSLVRDVIPPPSCDMVLNHYREAIRSGKSVRWEEESVYPSGQRYGEVAVTPLYDTSGLATHLIGIVHDITERKRREEKRAEDLLEAAPDAMVVVDQTGRIVLVNAQTERLFGYQREEILGQAIEVLIPKRFHDEYQAHRTKFFSEPRVRTMEAQLDLFGLRRDGSEFPVEISLSPFKADEGIFITSAIRDITDRKRAEEALRASEERLRLAQQAARIGTFERDVRTGAITWAEGLESLYGLLPDSLDGKTLTFFKDLIHPDDRERVADLIDKALKTGQPMRGEWRAIWPDGSVHWLAGRWQVLMDESGQPSRVVGVNMDVTERKLAEDALRESEERLRLAQSAAHIGTFDLNLKTGVDIWQPETEALYGLPPGGFGSTLAAFEDLIHPDDRERVKQLTQEMMRTGQTTEAEWRVVWPDGSVHWIAARCKVLTDASGERSRVVGVNMDVSERKQAEETLRESEEKFRSVFRDTGVCKVIVSPEGRFLAANKAFCDTLGYTEDDLLEKTVESITFHEDWPAFSNKLREALSERSGFQWFEKRCLHKSGRIVHTESSTSLILNREGNPQYFVGEVLDITKRKQVEEALSGMTRKLIDAHEQERTRIGRELHDDINQRLALLSLDLQQLENNPSEAQARARKIRKELDEISSDVEALSHELHSSKLQYLGVLAGIKSWCRDVAERQRLEIDFRDDVSSAIPYDVGISLFRVLQEAVHNAMKYSGAKRIEIEIREHGSAIHLMIRDSGRGFDVESAMHGKGLGLTSMRERVRLINGTISIHSQPLHGTTIQVRVPLTSEHDQERAAG